MKIEMNGKVKQINKLKNVTKEKDVLIIRVV